MVVRINAAYRRAPGVDANAESATAHLARPSYQAHERSAGGREWDGWREGKIG